MTRRPRVAHVTTVDLTLRWLLLPQMRRAHDEGFEVTAISAPGPGINSIETESIRHIPWPHATRAWRPIEDVRAFLALRRILRRERFDLVHTHNPKPGILGRVAARMTGTPSVVHTTHGLYATPGDRLIRKLPVLALEWIAARFSDLELYQSEEDLRWARRIGLVPSSRSALLGNGVDLGIFDPSAVSPERRSELRREFGIDQAAPVIGTVGRLVAEKGYREFFAAARAAREAVPEARFLAVGEIDPEKSDSLTAKELDRARGDVIITGWRTDVRDLLALMDVFVLASWREGVPRSAIEAAAMSTALVLTDIRGCREVARDGVEGVLVPPRDERRLARELIALLQDPERRNRLGAAARARAQEKFDENKVMDRVVDHYRRLLTATGAMGEKHGTLTVRSARIEDVGRIAELHREGLPEAFLPVLGDRFLRRLYRALTKDRQAVTLVAQNADGIVGFVAGVVSVPKFYRRFFVRHGVQAAVVVAPRLARPSVFARLLETARYPGRANALPEAELLAIAVDASARSRGAGRILTRAMLDGLAKRGARDVKVVVAADNEAANAFYADVGFEQASHLDIHQGLRSNVWVTQCR